MCGARGCRVVSTRRGASNRRARELHADVCETSDLLARSLAFQVLLDPIIAFTEGAIVAMEPVSQHVLAKEDFAFVVPASVTAGALVEAVRADGGELGEGSRV